MTYAARTGRARCATAGLSGLHPALGGPACVDHPFARPPVGEGVRQVVEPGSDLLVAVVGRRWAALGSLISERRGFVAASGFVLGQLGLDRRGAGEGKRWDGRV